MLRISYVSLKSDNITCVEMSYVLALGHHLLHLLILRLLVLCALADFEAQSSLL